MIKKILITVLLALVPFLIIGIVLLSLYLGIFQKFGGFAVPIALILILLVTIASVAGLIHMIIRWEAGEVSLANLVIKIIYAPIHALLYLIMMGMGNPFLFMLMPLPLIISLILMTFTGTLSLPAVIKGYANGNYRLPAAVIFCLLSYCYMADLIAAVIVFIKTRRG